LTNPRVFPILFNTELIFETMNIDENDKKLILQFFSDKKLFILSILKLPFVKILRAYGGYLGVQYDEGRAQLR
jgi:hypothetical protein